MINGTGTADVVAGVNAVLRDAAQMTYSSFDDGSGDGGGWQVKQTVGVLSNAEQMALKYWVSTTFDTVDPLPQYPSPEDIYAFPRRLVYTAMESGRVGFWHTAPAGADGSGRPGNVFAHLILTRGGDLHDEALRPIDLWRSPDWLTPYGPAEVTAAVITSPGVRRGTEVNRDRVIDFLCDPTEWRAGVLAVLLDAAAAAITGGPTVVLGVASADAAAMWIGCVTHFMSAPVAKSFHFSTFERADDLPIVIARGVHLVAVPTADLARLGEVENLVVVSGDETPGLGDLGGAPHTTSSGSVVEVTPWSVMAQSALTSTEVAHDILHKQDAVAAALGPVETHPAWAVAMAVAATDDLHDELVDEAAAVIARHSPEGLRSIAALVDSAASLLGRAIGQSAQDAWEWLDGAKPTAEGYSVSVEMILAVYVERALADEDWLVAGERVPALPSPPRAEWVPRHLADVVRRLVDRLYEMFVRPDANASIRLVRVLDLLVRCGCIGPTATNVEHGSTPGTMAPDQLPVMERCRVMFDRSVVPILVSPDADGFVDRCGSVSARTSAMIFIPVIAVAPALHQGAIGSRLSTVVLSWLLPQLPDPPRTDSLADGIVRRPDLVLAAEAAYMGLHGQLSSARPMARYAPLVLTRMCEQSSNPLVVPADPSPVFRFPFRDVRLLSSLLAGASDAHQSLLPARFLSSLLVTEPWSSDLQDLAVRAEWNTPENGRRPLADPSPSDVAGVAMAAIRLRSQWSEIGVEELTSLQRRLPTVLTSLRSFTPSEYAAGIARTVTITAVVAMTIDPEVDLDLDVLEPIVLHAHASARPHLISSLSEIARRRLIDQGHLAVAAIMGTAQPSRLPTPIEQLFGSLFVEEDDGDQSLLDAVVNDLVERGVYRGPHDVEEVEVLLGSRMRLMSNDGADKVFGQHRKLIRHWLDDRGLGSGGLMSKLRRK
ncbi:GAP1-N2 domain-containing protein [Williamsia sp. M5A3_1d]